MPKSLEKCRKKVQRNLKGSLKQRKSSAYAICNANTGKTKPKRSKKGKK